MKFRDYIILSVAAICFVVVVLSPRAYIVSSDSMRPTLVRGDIVACLKRIPIARGDIVAATLPGEDFFSVKRVVALPTDIVGYTDKALTINGETVKKTFVGELPASDPMDLVFEQSVDDHEFQVLESFGQSLSSVSSMQTNGYFLLGDNRDGSTDSRHFGSLEKPNLRCKLVAILATEMQHGFAFQRARLF